MSDKPHRPPITEHPDLLELDLDDKFDKAKHRKETMGALKSGAVFGAALAVIVVGVQKRRHKKEVARGTGAPPVRGS